MSESQDNRHSMTALERSIEGSKLQRFVGDGLMVAWWGRSTFSILDIETGQELDCFTRYGDLKGNPPSFDQAVAFIDQWAKLDDK